MLLSFFPPKIETCQTFLQQQAKLPFTYKEIQATKDSEKVKNYDNDFIRIKLGKGETTFRSACEAVRQWQMFPRSWTKIVPENAPVEVGTTVIMCCRFAGIWWGLPCRIVYVVNEQGRFGFAYGTLPGHVESGEELFLVIIETDGNVWYELKAFSRPRHLLARAGYVMVRLLQARFRQSSVKQMSSIAKNKLP